jgi:hypothetical protein
LRSFATYAILARVSLTERVMKELYMELESRSEEDVRPISRQDEMELEPPPSADLPESESQLFDLYEKIVREHPGSRDAEIFERIHEWTFSDFAKPAHIFAQITKAELDSWQNRNRINLSAGHIRPEHIDIERGHAWGQIRMTSHANRIHSMIGPPSADEVKLSWKKTHH